MGVAKHLATMPRARKQYRGYRHGEEVTAACVAYVCQVATRTASNWIDRGLIPGWRVPGHNERRVFLRDLIAFCRKQGMTGALERLQVETSPLLVAYGLDAPTMYALADYCVPDSYAAADCPAEVGCLFERWRGREMACVLDLREGRSTVLALARWLLRQEPRPRVVLLWPEDAEVSESAGEWAELTGLTILRHPVAAADVARAAGIG